MEKIKNFVKDNKEIVISSIIGAGVAIAGKAMYDMGINHGTKYAGIMWLAMLNADVDGILELRDLYISKADENTMRDFTKFGHETLNQLKKGVGL